jgi:PHD/YefM family antitoxin component YafN of YafNO toxin-antitoxin module
MNTQFLVDTEGRKTAVVLSIDDFRALIERLEELEDLRLIEERKSESRIDMPSLEDLLARVEAED